jgi:iron complex outermembrane recepter protein
MDCKNPAAVGLSVVVAAVLGALAPSSAGAEVRTFQIPSGQAKDTLETFGRQGHISLFSDPRVVNDQHTNAVSTSMEPIQALKAMLKGSGLRYVVIDRNTVVVKPRPLIARVARAIVGQGPEGPPPVGQPLLRSGNTECTDSSSTGSSSDCVVSVFGIATPRDIPKLPGVPVRRVADFPKEGIATAPDLLLRTILESTGGGPSAQVRSSNPEEKSNTDFGTGANLHGLSSADTLVLVDGRRLAPAGSNSAFTDISSIPLTAVDHVDVLADGFSGLYGADAIGGVINFVLRRSDLRQPPSQGVRIGTFASESFGEMQLSQSFAWHPSRGAGSLWMEYYKHDALFADDRKQATSDFTQYGGPNLDTLQGSPGNIIDLTTGSVWGIPRGQNGVGLRSSQLLAGQPNRYNLNQYATILPKESRFNIVADWQQLVSDRVSLSFDTIMSRRWVTAQGPGGTALLNVPSTNPYYVNPGTGDSVDVMYGFGGDVGPINTSGHVDNLQATVGLDVHLSGSWNLHAYAGHALESQQMTLRGLVNLDVVTADLSPRDPGDPFFNPFGNGQASDESIEQSIRLEPQSFRYDSAYSYINGSVTGRLFNLSTGPVIATITGEYRRQRFSGEVASAVSASPNTVPGVLERNMSALSTEFVAPLRKGDTAHVGSLDLSAGLRAEVYDSSSTVFAPQVGIRYRPTTNLTFSGNWAQWYRPPSLPDLSEAYNLSEIAVLPNPAAPAGFSSVLVGSGGNAKLTPERATSWNFAVQLVNPERPGVMTSLKYFDVRVRDRIYAVSDLPDTALSDPQYGWLVKPADPALRAAICGNGSFLGSLQDCLSAPIAAIVDMRLQNVTRLRSAGLDWESKMEFATLSGDAFNFGLISTYFLNYDEAYAPAMPLISLVSTAHNPTRLRIRATAGWTDNVHWITAAANYQGRYRDTDAIPERRVNSWTTFDLVVGIGLGDPGMYRDPPTHVSVSISNLLNSYPPVVFSSYGVAYDPDNATLLGRRINLALQRRW